MEMRYLRRPSNERMGTPSHIEYLHMSEGDKRRNLSRCIYYEKHEKRCRKIYTRCTGSSHCPFYHEWVEELKENTIPCKESIVAPVHKKKPHNRVKAGRCKMKDIHVASNALFSRFAQQARNGRPDLKLDFLPAIHKKTHCESGDPLHVLVMRSEKKSLFFTSEFDFHSFCEQENAQQFNFNFLVDSSQYTEKLMHTCDKSMASVPAFKKTDKVSSKMASRKVTQNRCDKPVVSVPAFKKTDKVSSKMASRKVTQNTCDKSVASVPAFKKTEKISSQTSSCKAPKKKAVIQIVPESCYRLILHMAAKGETDYRKRIKLCIGTGEPSFIVCSFSKEKNYMNEAEFSSYAVGRDISSLDYSFMIDEKYIWHVGVAKDGSGKQSYVYRLKSYLRDQYESAT